MTDTVVIDTSILVSALIGAHGPNRETIKRCLLGEYNPLISNALFQEYENVSKREQVLDICPLTPKRTLELLHSFCNVCRWVPIYHLWRPNIIDEGDNFLIELALAGNATHIITNNICDLLNVELKFPNLKTLTPETLLKGE